MRYNFKRFPPPNTNWNGGGRNGKVFQILVTIIEYLIKQVEKKKRYLSTGDPLIT